MCPKGELSFGLEDVILGPSDDLVCCWKIGAEGVARAGLIS